MYSLTNRQFRDLCYKTATGNLTTRRMTEKQFEACNIDNVRWEPLEYLDSDSYESVIADAATCMIREFKPYVNIKDK